MIETGGVRFAVLAMAATLLFGGCGDDDSRSRGEALCPAELDYAGHRYVGSGELKRDPSTTGRVETAVETGCGGGSAKVEVAELVDLPLERAFLARGAVYFRTDLPYPEQARKWYVAPRCESAGSFEVRGGWLAVQSPNETRFDGDMRLPYRLTVHVTAGPQDYLGTTIVVHATLDTTPALGPEDVKRALWEPGVLIAHAHCEDGKFVADALSTNAA